MMKKKPGNLNYMPMCHAPVGVHAKKLLTRSRAFFSFWLCIISGLWDFASQASLFKRSPNLSQHPRVIFDFLRFLQRLSGLFAADSC